MLARRRGRTNFWWNQGNIMHYGVSFGSGGGFEEAAGGRHASLRVGGTDEMRPSLHKQCPSPLNQGFPDGDFRPFGLQFPKISGQEGGSPMSFKLASLTLATLVAASTALTTLSVQIKEYDVPTPKSRPHDPALAPDGSLWYTGQGA